MRLFKKIKFEQFKKDISEDIEIYNSFLLPKRATKASACYDIYSLDDFCIKPGDVKLIPTGLKCVMNEDEVLMIFVRSSMGFKFNVRLTNQVGIIDCDYFENINNDGHIWVKLQNHGDKDFNVKKNEAFCQGMFIKYLKTDDDYSEDIRISGIGSTNKED